MMGRILELICCIKVLGALVVYFVVIGNIIFGNNKRSEMGE